MCEVLGNMRSIKRLSNRAIALGLKDNKEFNV